jgi:ABC-type lipoprotein export system ATPase subunit
MVLVYFICGLPGSIFFFGFIILLLANFISFYSAMLLAAVTENSQAALSVFPDIIITITMFSGFQISLKDIPAMWIWAPYLTPARWVFEALAVNEWEQFDETDDTTIGGGNGITVLQDLGFEGYNKANSIWIIILILLAIMGATYVAMRPRLSKLEFVNKETEVDAPREPTMATRDDEKLAKGHTSSSSGPDDEEKEEREESVDALPEGFGRRSTFDVAWYRQNTGDLTGAKGCKLVFRNLTYDVPDPADKTKMKTLLNTVTGRVNPGEMCALMGASGAGKSTLLDVIAGRKTVGRIVGDILFNGAERTPAIMLQTAYVMQDNVHIGSLTVKETLMYAAHLRLPQTLSLELKEKRVGKIMDMLGLTEHGNTLVGDENTRGISGGQMKRLSIGVEIVNLPDLIFLDEPTTGLDSAISYDVMSAVKNLTNQNRTVSLISQYYLSTRFS